MDFSTDNPDTVLQRLRVCVSKGKRQGTVSPDVKTIFSQTLSLTHKQNTSRVSNHHLPPPPESFTASFDHHQLRHQSTVSLMHMLILRHANVVLRHSYMVLHGAPHSSVLGPICTIYPVYCLGAFSHLII